MTRHSGQNEDDLPPQGLESIARSVFQRKLTIRGLEFPVSRAKPQALAQRFPHVTCLVGYRLDDGEIVVGRIGQFWKLAGGESPQIPGRQAFVTFGRAGLVKVATNFLIRARDQGSTEVSSSCFL